MARSFAGSPDRIVAASAAVASYPISMACWVNPSNVSGTYTPMGLGANGATDASAFHLRVNTTANAVARAVDSAAGSSIATSGGTLSAGVWTHIAGVFVSGTQRTVYLQGTGTQSTTSRTVAPAVFAKSTIGANPTTAGAYAGFFQGSVAEAAWWAAELTADEIGMLAAGYSPLFVRPAALRAYTPLFGRAGNSGDEEDWVGGLTFAQTSSPTLADHPRIIYPRRMTVIPFATAAAGSLIKTVGGLSIASVKTIGNLSISSVKTLAGLSN